jgi:hypothetical protein
VFVTSNNSESGLDAVVTLEPDDESPHSVWLYLSNGDEIISDCFLVNLIEPEDSVGKPENHDAPPPVIRRFLSSRVPSELPKEGDLDFRWSETGRDVAVSIGGTVVGFTVSGENRGFSRALSQAGPWGNPWSDDLFSSHFSA